MPTEKKVSKVAEVQEQLSHCTVAIATNYTGIKANDMTAFRQKLRDQHVEYMVVKDTLARIAATNTGKDALNKLLIGPVGIAFGRADETLPARILVEYIRAAKSPMRITGGLLGTRVITPEEVNSLATLPSRDILLSRLLGQMNAPMTLFVGVLSANLRNLVGVLDARKRQLESAPPAAAPETQPAAAAPEAPPAQAA